MVAGTSSATTTAARRVLGARTRASHTLSHAHPLARPYSLSARLSQAPGRAVFGATPFCLRLPLPTLRCAHAALPLVRTGRGRGAHGRSPCVSRRSPGRCHTVHVGHAAASECRRPRPQVFHDRAKASDDRWWPPGSWQRPPAAATARSALFGCSCSHACDASQETLVTNVECLERRVSSF